MASGDNNNKNYYTDEEDDDDDNVTIAQPESNTRDFVTQFIVSAAQIDIERNTNSQIAQDIINKSEITNNSNCNPIVSDLRRIADEIDKNYGQTFEDLVTKAMSKKIIYDVKNGYQYFVEITSSLFESGITVGRIFALLMFGYRWIVRSLKQATDVGNPLLIMISYLVKFLNSRVIQSFIASIGGWSAVLHSLSSRSTIIFAAFVGVFVFFAVMYTK